METVDSGRDDDAGPDADGKALVAAEVDCRNVVLEAPMDEEENVST